MSTHTASVFTRRLPLIFVVALVAAISLWLFLRSTPIASVSKASAEPLVVAEGEAGKVGDLTITREAMDLAEIQVKPATMRVVSEELNVSGSVQAGGDQLVKVTPPAPGKVVRLMAGLGDLVRAGQTLAILESKDLAEAQAAYRLATARHSAAFKDLARQKELARLGQFGRPQVEDARTKASEAERDLQLATRDLSEERTNLLKAESGRKTAASKVGQSKTELDVLGLRLEREERLLKEDLIAKQDLERTKADHAKAVADVEVSEAEAAQAEAHVAGAKERVVSAEKGLDNAMKRAEIAKGALAREEKVYAGQFLTSRETVAAESAVRQAQIELQGAAEAVRILGGKPGAGSSIALQSPLSGRVQERTATLGETIDPEHAAFTVVNLDKVWAQLAIPPESLGLVRVGDAVELTSESISGITIRGRVMSVGTVADEATRSVPVRTTLENADGALRPGMFVRGRVVTDVRKERIAAPLDALQEHNGRPTIYVEIPGTPGAFEVRHVGLGVEGDDWREISFGLKPGERIAVSGTFYLKSEALKSQLSDGCCAPAGG